MANVIISEWSPCQVSAWLRGLGPAVSGYVTTLQTRGLNGARLLALRCDDLEALGVRVIGHQELLLEAIEHLRNFHFELQRENVQQLAMRLSVAARCLHGELRSHHDGAKVETQTLSDVARVVAAVKPLVCWLNRTPFRSAGSLAERKRALLNLSLEAATCARRDRFAVHPTRAVAAAAEALAALADYIVQDVSDPMILQPASLSTVTLQQGERPLDIALVPSFCGHQQLADIRFGSPAHASGQIEHGDEIVQVGEQIVVGWDGDAVLRQCEARAAACKGELALTLRRRPGARASALSASPLHAYRPYRRHAAAPMYHQQHHHLWPWMHADLALFRRQMCSTAVDSGVSSREERHASVIEEDATAADFSDADEGDPLWAPDELEHLNTRMYPPKPRALVQRRHTISGGSPISKSPNLITEQFWQEPRNHKISKHTGSAQIGAGDDQDELNPLYRRDKAVSCSTGLELSPRPKTCLGVAIHDRTTEPNDTSPVRQPQECRVKDVTKRGKLDKSHSTPAYDFNNDNAEPGSLVTQIIPESPTTPTDSPTILIHSAEKADQILDFKKSSSQIGEAILQQQHKRVTTSDTERTKFSFSECEDSNTDADMDDVLETTNAVMLENQNQPAGPTNDQMKFHQEIVQAINEHRIKSAEGPKSHKQEPPEPPPRPITTQRSHTLWDSSVSMQEVKMKEYPPLIPVKQPELTESKEYSPLKPLKIGDNLQISLPLKYLTKHDIHVIPNVESSPRRELLPLNQEFSPQGEVWGSRNQVNAGSTPDIASAHSLNRLETISPMRPAVTSATNTAGSASPTASVVRGIFPSSKSKSLKKKNSILAKRRKVSVRDLGVGTWQGLVLQRVRVRGAGGGVWARRWYVLRDNTLYGFRALDCDKADCLIFLKGFTASSAPEVKSKPFAFKVYHTGTVFYFAADSQEAMTTWLDHIGRATMLCYDSWERAHKDKKVDESKHFSETDYSEGDLSDKETPEKKGEGREKDKSKFGSLKKLTHRIHKSESQESVGPAATSLDRKYLRFFSRAKSKTKNATAPVPTEHYRSYRRVTPAGGDHVVPHHGPAKIKKVESLQRTQVQAPVVVDEPAKPPKKLPKPINYIHASNPNLLDFEKSDFVAKPSAHPCATTKVHKPENFMGFVTLHEFMLKKQEEERREVYSNRVLMGVERDTRREERANSKKAAKELQKQWERIVPDVIYGELPPTDDQLPIPVLEQIQNRSLPRTPEVVVDRIAPGVKPVSMKDKDGYEKIVYTFDTEHPPQLPRKPIKTEDQDSRRRSVGGRELGYETIYGGDGDSSGSTGSRVRRRSAAGISVHASDGDSIHANPGDDTRKLAPPSPPKIMPKSKQVLNRQSSLTGSGVESGPVFVQGESPEKFWLNSLRRNDRVHSRTNPDPPRVEPKPLKSAAQYTPLSLPPAPAAALATAPHLNIALDAREPSPVGTSISRLRQMFQGGGTEARTHAETAGATEGAGWALRVPGVHYPHLQCPPTFEPESYSLAERAHSHQRRHARPRT